MNCPLKGTKSPCSARGGTTQSPNEFIHVSRSLTEIRIHRVGSTRFGKKSLVTRILDAVTYDLLFLWCLLRLPRHDMVIAFTSPPLAGLHGALAARLWRARFSRALASRSHRRCWPARPHLGERWPSRLVATAAEKRLSFRHIATPFRGGER